MKKKLVLSSVVIGSLMMAFVLGAMLLAPTAQAGDYYSMVPSLPSVKIGVDSEGATKVETVTGKEYSHTDWFSVYHGKDQVPVPGDPNLLNVEDHNAFGADDPLQVVSWDGKAGPIGGNSGSVDAFDYGTLTGFQYENGQVDALANRGDFLLRQVVRNEATLLFSVTADIDKASVLPPIGPPFSSAGIIAKAHVHYEDPAPLDGLEPLDTWALIEAPPAGPGLGPGVNHHVVEDLDALEVWGPEPPSHNRLAGSPTPVVEGYIGGFPGPPTADADRFSLDGDSASGVSVWAYLDGDFPLPPPPSPSVAPWIFHSEIVSAVEKMFLPDGFEFDPETRDQIDVDGTMALDVDRGLDGTSMAWSPGDELLFSIDPIAVPMAIDPASGALLPFAPIDGGEIMHLVKTGLGPGAFTVSFLKHGGHVWDTGFDVSGTFGYFFEDVDALEAVGTLTGGTDIDTPEPTCLVMLLIGLVSAGWLRRR